MDVVSTVISELLWVRLHRRYCEIVRDGGNKHTFGLGISVDENDVSLCLVPERVLAIRNVIHGAAAVSQNAGFPVQLQTKRQLAG